MDDTLHASATYCKECLEAEALCKYGQEILFKTQGGSAHHQPWCDLALHVWGYSVRIGMLAAETAWIARESPHPSKYRYPPFLGDAAADKTALRSLVLGRLARLRDAKLDDGALIQALVYDLALWGRSGYSPKFTRRVWTQSSRDPHVNKLIKLAWDVVQNLQEQPKKLVDVIEAPLYPNDSTILPNHLWKPPRRGSSA